MASRSKTKQFGNAKAGAREKGFKQWTEKTATAAMQGRPMPSGHGKADAGPRKDAKKQFGKASGKAVF